jgi:site-specific DNA-methyltransferase (adenine-specific)
MDKTKVFNCDCLPAMREFPDKYFELAIVDPPYGETCVLTGGKAKANGYREYWDKITDEGHWNIAPDLSYFKELFRVSKNQIIWGANHLCNFLPASSGWVFWDKGQRDFSFSDGELAYTSFKRKLKAITIHRQELQTEPRQHPTQKPTKLYKWLLKNYAKEGDKILDTHLGSQSSRIAAFDMGFDFTGYELDKDYFEAGNKRFNQHKAQLKLFS